MFPYYINAESIVIREPRRENENDDVSILVLVDAPMLRALGGVARRINGKRKVSILVLVDAPMLHALKRQVENQAETLNLVSILVLVDAPMLRVQ